jgi:phenylacetate-CoA ligase
MKWWQTYCVLLDMKERLAWTTEEICRYQVWKLRDLIGMAYHNSPFYRRLFDQHSVQPDNLRGIEDLKQLPILEKQMLRETDPLDVVTVQPDTDSDEIDWMEELTSGSTGHPLRILRTWRDLYYIKAKVIRAFGQTGFRFYHRQAVLKSSVESLTGRHWFERLGVLRKYWLSVTDTPEENLARLRQIRPQHLHGYPSGLLSIAEMLRTRGEALYIPMICTGAEVLDPVVRRLIAESFNAEVFDLYGTREVGNIAWECRAHQGMHVNDDALIVELLDDEGNEVSDGSEGEVVVTYLDGREFPFIRYRLGDRAIRMKDRCSCGIAFSRLERVIGRSDERIRLPSGEWLSGMVFQEIRDTLWLSSFRIVQEDVKSIKLQIVPRLKPSEEQVGKLVQRVKGLLRGELEVIPEILERLDYDSSGKIRAVISRLPVDPDDGEAEKPGEGA